MMIQWNNTNVHALPYVTYRAVRLRNKKTGKIRVVQQVDTTQSPQDIKWLRPGWNEFPKEIWEQNKNHPQIQKFLKKGLIVLMSDTVTVKKNGKKLKKVVGEDDSPIRLKWFEEKRAIEIATKTFDREILQRWLDEETRSKVKRKLEKQLQPLLPKSDDDDRSEDTSGNDGDDDSED